MLAGLPQLRRWHDALVQRDSFRRTWPQGYSLEGAYAVVGDMAVDKAQSMYGFQFPDLATQPEDDDSTPAAAVAVVAARGGMGRTASNKTAAGHHAGDLGSFCL